MRNYDDWKLDNPENDSDDCEDNNDYFEEKRERARMDAEDMEIEREKTK